MINFIKISIIALSILPHLCLGSDDADFNTQDKIVLYQKMQMHMRLNLKEHNILIDPTIQETFKALHQPPLFLVKTKKEQTFLPFVFMGTVHGLPPQEALPQMFSRFITRFLQKEGVTSFLEIYGEGYDDREDFFRKGDHMSSMVITEKDFPQKFFSKIYNEKKIALMDGLMIEILDDQDCHPYSFISYQNTIRFGNFYRLLGSKEVEEKWKDKMENGECIAPHVLLGIIHCLEDDDDLKEEFFWPFFKKWKEESGYGSIEDYLARTPRGENSQILSLDGYMFNMAHSISEPEHSLMRIRFSQRADIVSLIKEVGSPRKYGQCLPKHHQSMGRNTLAPGALFSKCLFGRDIDDDIIRHYMKGEPALRKIHPSKRLIENLNNRNQKWFQKMFSALENQSPAFFAFGMNHFEGPQGLFSLIKKAFPDYEFHRVVSHKGILESYKMDKHEFQEWTRDLNLA